MKAAIFKLNFKTGIHIGEGALDTCASTIMSDTLFSALCIEALKLGKFDCFVNYVKSDKLVISNAFPFDDNGLYLPKPIKRIEGKKEQDPADRKKYKKLQWIPVSNFKEYLQGNLEINNFYNRNFGELNLITHAKVARDQKDTEPYHVATFVFKYRCGLYVLVGYEDEESLSLTKELIYSLGISGIGGKKSSGLGKFSVFEQALTEADFPMLDSLNLRSNKNHNSSLMLLNMALPRNDELENSLTNASFLVVKRSGFITAEDNRAELKKQTLFAFSAGSCFEQPFEGDIYDVSNGYGHKVYRYLKPFFVELNL